MEQAILGNASYYHSDAGSQVLEVAASSICFKDVWDTRAAHFRPCFLPVVDAIPALVAALILSGQILRLLVPWRASWMRPFVQEHTTPEIEVNIVSIRRWTGSLIALTTLSAVGLCLQFVIAFAGERSFTLSLGIIPWFVILLEILAYRMRTVPYAILFIALLHLIVQATILGEMRWSIDLVHFLRITDLAIATATVLVVLVMPFRDPLLPTKEISQPSTEPTSALRSPEEAFTLWQFLTVSWVGPLLTIGLKRQLEDADVWSLPYAFGHRRLHEHFRRLRGTVVRRLVTANGIDICILVVFGILEQLMTYAGPVLLQAILSSMEDPSIPVRVPMVYAGLTLAARCVSGQLGVLLLWFGRRCYERSRGEMITMLYEKTLNRKIAFELPKDEKSDENHGGLNGHAIGDAHQAQQQPTWDRFKAFFSWKQSASHTKEPTSSGKLLNLMRNDVYEVSQRFWEIDNLVRKPVSVILSVSLVVNFLGWSSMLAVVGLVAAQSINAILARINVYVEKKRRAATDHKLQAITQFVESIRHLRWYGWQDAWLTQILSARQRELVLRLISSGVNLTISFVNALSLDLSVVFAFFAYTVIAKKPLTIDIAFPAVQLFQMMITNLRELPQLIITLINAWVAVGRIEDFMAEPDRSEDSTEPLLGDEMALYNASFAWPGSAEVVLKDINISFPEGMTVICGEVAAGKTALLQGLLGELDLQQGQLVRPQESIGYCAQTPWLQSMSIRENILFSAPYEDAKYKAVLDACALTPDLAELKSGDLSLIGENGIGLSGGQRARVALARAVYSRARILLLDDPLSALDQQTAESIVQSCFAGPLASGRTIVLVTHRKDLVVNIAQQIIKLESGRASVVDQDVAAQDILHTAVSAPPGDAPTTEQIEATKAAAVPAKFIEDEHRERGGIKASVYWEYIKAGTLTLWLITVLLLVLYRVLNLAEAWLLKAWGEAYATESISGPMNMAELVALRQTGLFDDYPTPESDIRPWLWTLAFLAVGQTLSYTFSLVGMTFITYTAGKNMFRAIMKKVAYANFRFYDVTPVGRLMNRMTSDFGVVDGGIGRLLQSVSWMVISWVAAVVVIASITPAFLVFTVVLATAFVLVFRRFIATSQSLRRLEMVSLTPLISNFGDLINGLTTVRAFNAQPRFMDRVIEVVDTFQKMDHFYWSTQAWLQWRYDMLSAIANFLLFVLALATGLSPGLTAFALLSAQRFVMATHSLCRSYGELQMEFISVERVVELLHLEQEPQGTVSPPAWWPSFGSDVVFDNVTIKYAPHLDPALSKVSFTVKGGSKTAILGRTGSGKSTLAVSMLATILPEIGSITVDGIDLAHVDKQLLRTRITFLAQDPVLFPGTMRQNLDPVTEYADEDCELVLRRVCAKQDWTLDTKVEAGGKNLSQGQRQLVGLARAVLRRSAIIILDEATASIDRETAMQIQDVMHEEMKESTVITIAHRLEAVKNADYCIILGKGKVVKQGPAAEMLADEQNQLSNSLD